MTTIDFLNNLKDITDNLQLNDRAIKTLSKIKVITSTEDLHPDFLKGFSREEIIFKPKQQLIELYNHSGFDPSIMTIIGIYIEDKSKKWADHLMPIGYFEYQVDLDGEYINDHLEITERK